MNLSFRQDKCCHFHNQVSPHPVHMYICTHPAQMCGKVISRAPSPSFSMQPYGNGRKPNDDHYGESSSSKNKRRRQHHRPRQVTFQSPGDAGRKIAESSSVSPFAFAETPTSPLSAPSNPSPSGGTHTTNTPSAAEDSEPWAGITLRPLSQGPSQRPFFKLPDPTEAMDVDSASGEQEAGDPPATTRLHSPQPSPKWTSPRYRSPSPSEDGSEGNAENIPGPQDSPSPSIHPSRVPPVHLPEIPSIQLSGGHDNDPGPFETMDSVIEDLLQRIPKHHPSWRPVHKTIRLAHAYHTALERKVISQFSSASYVLIIDLFRLTTPGHSQGKASHPSSCT
jgi:hypothetical protein